MEFRDRLKEALRISGKTRTQLAEELDISPTAVSNWFTGKTEGMRAQTATRFEAATGVRAAWIVTGEGPKMVTDDPGLATAPQGLRYLPRLDSDGVIEWWNNRETDTPSGHAKGHWLPSSRRYSPSAFAIESTDSAVHQEFPSGDHLIVDPDVPPRPGVFVLAIVDGFGAVIRRYRLRSIAANGPSASFDLAPSDENYPIVSSADTPISIVGPVVEHRRYLAEQ
ncbi:MAG: LexA family transcriptional regulator [Lautropia sp.]|nr:LexA family transcriptional regulator [Lautropia sp.]